MIPILTTMVALLTLMVAIDLIGQDRSDGLNIAASLVVIAAIIGTGYVWHLSFQVEREMAEAQQQIESLWR